MHVYVYVYINVYEVFIKKEMICAIYIYIILIYGIYSMMIVFIILAKTPIFFFNI